MCQITIKIVVANIHTFKVLYFIMIIQTVVNFLCNTNVEL